MFVVDRIENNYAVCIEQETENVIHFLLADFPCNVSDGDSFEIHDNKIVMVENKETHERISKKMELLWN